MNYEYDEKSAVKADEAANRISEPGPYVGKFTAAEAVTSNEKGAQGIRLVFEAPGNGHIDFTLWLASAEGEPYFGMNFVNALMFLFGVKSLKSVPGKVERYDEEAKARLEVDGEVFPDLIGKPVGIVLQQEKYTTKTGGTGERMNLFAVFQPETRLLVSEIKDKKTTPVKLDRLLKGLKVKDKRKVGAAEPAQPAMGGVDGY